MNILISENLACLEQDLLRRVKKHIRIGQGYMLLLVPAQASFMMEQRIVEECSPAGFLTVEVMSFEKLAERILTTAGGREDTVIDSVGLAMLCKQALKGIGSALRSLDPDQRDIHQKAAELISAMKSENLTPSLLRMIAKDQRQSTQDKLLDIADLFEYVETHSSAPDLRDLEKRAGERAGLASFLQGAQIAVYGFDTFTSLRIDMLRALLPASASMDIYLEMDEEDALYKSQRYFLKQLEDMASSLGHPVRKYRLPSAPYASPELNHLFYNVFSYDSSVFPEKAPAIRIGRGATRREELIWAAENILSLVSKGIHLREIGVLSGQPAAYENEIRDVFSAAGIRYFYDGKRSLKDSRLAVFILSAIDIFESRWRIDHVLRHMKTNLLPLTRLEAESLARFAKERRLFGSSFQSGFKNSDDSLEEYRNRGFSPLIHLFQMVKKEKVHFAHGLISYLDELSVEARLEQEADRLQASGFGEEALFTRQLYEKTVSLLEQAAVFGESMSAADLRDILLSGFEAAQIAVIPPCTDEIVVGDVTHSILPHKKAIFILGANDGALPPLPDYSGLLGQAETEEIKAAFPAFPDKPDYDSQKPFIRRCLLSGDALFLSYTDKDKNPSYIVDKIRRTFPLIETESCAKAVIPSVKGGLESLAADIRILCDQEEAPFQILGAYLHENSPYTERLLACALHTNAPTPISTATARQLYGELRGSASLVEGYYYCPYKNFLDRGIRPVSVENGAPDDKTAGIYAHQLLESFTKSLNNRGRRWGDLSDQEIDRLLDQSAEEFRGEIPQFSSKRFQYNEKRIRREVSASCKAIQRQLADTACDTTAVEQPFGYRGELKIETPLGNISLVGKIDRIDTVTAGGRQYVRVIDYKTGSAAFSPKKFAAGVGLQLIIYLMAVAALFDQAEPAGAFYFHVSYPVLKAEEKAPSRMDKYIMEGIVTEDYHALTAFTPEQAAYKSMKISLSKDGDALVVKAGENTYTRDQLYLLMDLARDIVKDAAMSIYSGRNEISPLSADTVPCDYCPYQGVCRFDGVFSGNQCRVMEERKKADLLKLAEERSTHGTD